MEAEAGQKQTKVQKFAEFSKAGNQARELFKKESRQSGKLSVSGAAYIGRGIGEIRSGLEQGKDQKESDCRLQNKTGSSDADHNTKWKSHEISRQYGTLSTYPLCLFIWFSRQNVYVCVSLEMEILSKLLKSSFAKLTLKTQIYCIKYGHACIRQLGKTKGYTLRVQKLHTSNLHKTFLPVCILLQCSSLLLTAVPSDAWMEAHSQFHTDTHAYSHSITHTKLCILAGHKDWGLYTCSWRRHVSLSSANPLSFALEKMS